MILGSHKRTLKYWRKMQSGQRSEGVFYWGLRVLFFSFFPCILKVFVMRLNVSRGFMFWAVFCTLNQCYAFTGWEQNVPWDLLQLKCLSITTSHLPQAWQHFFGGLPRRFWMSQLYAKEKGFLYLILEVLHLKSTNAHFIIWYMNVQLDQLFRGTSQWPQ